MENKKLVTEDVEPEARGVVWFRFRSSSPAARLSNFWVFCDEKKARLSVEALYQASKIAYCTDEDGEPLAASEAKRLETAILSVSDGLAAKKLGTKTQFKKWRIVLDTDTFNKDAPEIMERCIKLRAQKDPWFCRQLLRARKHGWTFAHSATRVPNQWTARRDKSGKYLPERGTNLLGEIMNKVALSLQ